MKKKLISTLCASAMILTGGLTLTACGDKSESRIMNVSLNPEVEFVLDKDNKVLSVNAINEEGNIIISGNAEFVGKDANEAVKLFMTISKENGYLVSGSVSTDKNELKVALSGSSKEIEKLYKEIESSVKTKLEELDITGRVTKITDITNEKLQELVAECAPYLDEAKIQAMKYDELINEIKKSRNETKELYSQGLKEAYYQAKADALRLAQLEKVKENLGVVQAGIISGLQTGYTSAMDSLESIRKQMLLDEDSAYQLALKSFNEAKINYLKKRKEIAEMDSSLITQEVQDGLANLDQLVETAESALTGAYETADEAIKGAEGLLTTAYEGLVSKVTELGGSLDIVSENLTQAITDFTTEFESEYASYKTKANERITAFKNSVNPTNA